MARPHWGMLVVNNFVSENKGSSAIFKVEFEEGICDIAA